MPPSTHLRARMGHAELTPPGPFEAGSIQSPVLTYTAGFFGIDDSGSLKIVHRLASDMATPRLDDPAAPGYVSVEASNGALLEVRWDPKGSFRPFDRTLYIKVVRGFLREGDRIVVRYGDPAGGSPGIRMQTFCENAFEFRVLVDAFATCEYVELRHPPAAAIVPGPPSRWTVVLPTLRRTGDPFRLAVRGDDAWGNPSDRCDLVARLRASAPVEGLPDTLRLEPGRFATVVEGLSVTEPGDLAVELLGPDGGTLARSNPMRVAPGQGTRAYWADLHGQSGETVGTNTARDWFLFARDRAFLDAACHQGNDFQMSDRFWSRLNALTGKLDRDGVFVAFPGYEWSGNTGLGGDRNVIYRREGRPIHRSSRVLVADPAGPGGDAHTVEALLERLRDEDCLVVPHVGGRYADLARAHDPRLERSVEIHSAWGTFEWLAREALSRGWRIGITANSDGHKGRPGASHPGASHFGAYGGLTCLLAPELSREALFDALRRRHHYATTGVRMIANVTASFDGPARVFEDDPALGPTAYRTVPEALMGDIVARDGDRSTLRVEVVGAAPVERIELRNGVDTLETWRPFGEADLGRRIRVVWEGAADRGRGRETVWDGGARLEGNRFETVEALNRWNPEKRFERVDERRLAWEALTTGGFGGFEARLEDPGAGTLEIGTPLVTARVPVADIGLEDRVWELGGVGRRLRVFRLPDHNPWLRTSLERTIDLSPDRDAALWVCVTTEDGHRAWSSPIHIIRGDR